MEQENSRINASPGPFNSGYLRDPALNERNDVVFEKAKDYPRKKKTCSRPQTHTFLIEAKYNIDCKLSAFVMYPSDSCPSEILKPNLDIDYLKDPEEFFLAYERLENAKREIQKQMGGVSFELNQNNKSPRVRQRRPGLLRNNKWRLVRYKHRYSLGTSDHNYHSPSFQEIYKPGSQGFAGEGTDKNGPCLASLESELTDSSVAEEKIDDILNELQHSSCDSIEGDVAFLHLQESLQIRPIILQKSSIPDLADNQVADLKSFECDLSRPGKVLSDAHNLSKEMRNKTPLKQRRDAGSTLQQLPSASPTPPKSPFAFLSSLLKHYSFSSTSVDPFPLIDDDNLPARNASAVDQEINLINSGEPASLIKDLVGKTNSVGATRKHASTSGKSKEDNSKKLGFYTNIDSKEPLVDIDGDIGRNDMGDGFMDVTVCGSHSEIHEENMQEAEHSVYRDDLDLDSVNPLDQSTPVGLQSNAMDEGTISSNDGEAEQCLQVPEKTKTSKASVKRRKDKTYSRREQKNKRFSRRQSLAAAGTSWKSGVRRSTRIKTRPLEYWKGERLVCGRIHESECNYKPYYGHAHGESRNCVLTLGLATVIGVKYMSPGSTDGKPTMKLKSYVSDEHKELLAMASKY